MEVKASLKNLRIGPRKVRLMTKNWRGRHPDKVMAELSLQPYKSVEVLVKLLKQAVANAVNVHKLDKADLLVDSIQVGDAFNYKRMDRSHGARFDRGMIRKRGSNVYLSIRSTEKPLESKPAPKITVPVLPTKKTVKKIAKKNGSKS